MFASALSLPILLQLTLMSPLYALLCYNCSNIADANECLTVAECRAGQSCYMDHRQSGQTRILGCTDNLQCGVFGGTGGSLVGRDLKERQTSDCHECCSTDKCNKYLCVHLKLHGGLKKWSGWEACTVTCGVGIERRHRNCSNPKPDRFGEHCFGDTLDDRTCLPGPCANGGWSDWGQWSKCTVSCDSGLQSRSRTCTKPRPSPHGGYCEGDPSETALCNKNTCTPNILFVAHNLVDLSPSAGQTMIFNTTLVNEGNAYYTSTGIFTAPVNGTYSFSTQFCVNVNKALYVAILVDEIKYATADIYDQDSTACNTANAVAMLQVDEKVWVKCTSGSSSSDIVYPDDSYYMNSFSGYLVH